MSVYDCARKGMVKARSIARTVSALGNVVQDRAGSVAHLVGLEQRSDKGIRGIVTEAVGSVSVAASFSLEAASTRTRTGTGRARDLVVPLVGLRGWAGSFRERSGMQ